MSRAPSPPRLLWNLVSVHVGWLSCVVGAAHGVLWFGPLVVAVLFAVHLALAAARRREIAIGLTAGLVGYALDSVVIAAGAFTFAPAAVAAPALLAPTTLWMVALWLNFATILNGALYWLSGRPALAAVLGFIGGPIAYYGGVRLGALVTDSTGPMLALVALEWALACPLLVSAAARIGRRLRQPVPAEAPA